MAQNLNCVYNDLGYFDNQLNLDLSNGEIEERKSSWTPPEPKESRGVLAKYAKLVSSASLGAITDGD